MGDFKGEADSSDKRYSFCIADGPRISSVHLFESAINLLSYATLLKMNGRDWWQAPLLSLAGVFKQKEQFAIPLALSQDNCATAKSYGYLCEIALRKGIGSHAT